MAPRSRRSWTPRPTPGRRIRLMGFVEGTALSLTAHSTQLQRAVAAALATASDVRDGYERGIRAIATSLGWRVGAVWEIDEHAPETLRCVALWCREDPRLSEFVELTRSLALRPGEGLPGRVWDHGQPMWIADFASEQALPRHGSAREAGLHAAVCFPVVSERGLVGVLELLGDS